MKLAPAMPKFVMIRQLLELKQEDRLNLHPFFQRALVWPDDVKRYLIETIVKGFPMPEVFIHANGRTFDVIDGQQRLNAIFEFIENRFVLPDLRHYKSLSPDEKKRFLDYPVAVREVVQYDEETVREIFRRLNTNLVPLTAQELRHARFTGLFIRLVEELAEDPFWLEFRIVTKKEADRMKTAEYVSELLLGIIEGPQDGKYALTYAYEKYDKDFDVDAWRARFKAVLELLKEVLEGAYWKNGSWRNKTHFYALFLAMYQLQKERPYAKKPIPAENILNARGALLRFIKLLRDEKFVPSGDGPVRRYNEEMMKGGLGQKESRARRIHILHDLLQPYAKV